MLRKFVLCVFFIASVCRAENKLNQLFPEPHFINGWSLDGRPTHYTPENLYDYIDGEAELFHDYGFRELATLTYYQDSPEDTFFVINIYDMGSDLNAFGIYSTYRYPGYDFDSVGVEAIVSDYGLKFYKGQYFVDISMGDATVTIQGAAHAAADTVSKKINAPLTPPDFLNLLPLDHQIDKTLRYVASGMLNQTFLPEGIEAQYQFDGDEISGFIIRFDADDQVAEGIEELKLFFGESKQLHQDDLSNREIVGIQTPYHGILLCSLHDRYLFGVQDIEDIHIGIQLLESIKDKLN